jgi:hypothetical protein
VWVVRVEVVGFGDWVGKTGILVGRFVLEGPGAG